MCFRWFCHRRFRREGCLGCFEFETLAAGFDGCGRGAPRLDGGGRVLTVAPAAAEPPNNRPNSDDFFFFLSGASLAAGLVCPARYNWREAMRFSSCEGSC